MKKLIEILVSSIFALVSSIFALGMIYVALFLITQIMGLLRG